MFFLLPCLWRVSNTLFQSDHLVLETSQSKAVLGQLLSFDGEPAEGSPGDSKVFPFRSD